MKPAFYLAWRSAGGGDAVGLVTVPDRDPASPVTTLTRLAVVAPYAPNSASLITAAPTPAAALTSLDGSGLLSARLDPLGLTVTVAAVPGLPHYFRLADGTVKPLPLTPPPLTCQAGDAYLAVTPAAARLAAAEPGGPSTAIARFVHLRDYFNAGKLAAAVLEHLLALGGGESAVGAAVLVVEAR